jgi:hypothetical protein
MFHDDSFITQLKASETNRVVSLDAGTEEWMDGWMDGWMMLHEVQHEATTYTILYYLFSSSTNTSSSSSCSHVIGHWFMVEKPEATVQNIREFLR